MGGASRFKRVLKMKTSGFLSLTQPSLRKVGGWLDVALLVAGWFYKTSGGCGVRGRVKVPLSDPVRFRRGANRSGSQRGILTLAIL